jgi:DNA-binding NarL/FixJ family response regulator
LEARHDDAQTHLGESLALAKACAAPFERALTLLEFARLRAAQGQTDETHQILNEVRTICEPLQARPALEQVAAVEAQLQEQPRAAVTPFGLTPRELDVLRLVAEGLTDPEVAERLYVSPRTVSSHLTSVYTKLGVSSRAAATRIAVEHRFL